MSPNQPLLRLGFFAALLLLSLSARGGGMVDYQVINMRNAKDVNSFLLDQYGSRITDITRSLTIGITVKPFKKAAKCYYIDVIFLNKTLEGSKSFTSITT